MSAADFYNNEKISSKKLRKFNQRKAELAAEQNNTQPKTTVASIKAWIEGDREMRGSTFSMLPIWSAIMEAADEQGNFVSNIVEGALNGKFVSEKQAWCVAYFAKNNALLN